MSVERINLAPGLSVSRVLTGLWQIADMERDGRTIDLAQTAAAMRPYVDAGLTSFDMACTPWRVKEAKKPRRPKGACSTIIEEAPEISPATAKPWIRRRTTRSAGASRPTWA